MIYFEIILFIELEFDSIIVANDLNYDEMRSAFSNYKRALRNDFDVNLEPTSSIIENIAAIKVITIMYHYEEY